MLRQQHRDMELQEQEAGLGLEAGDETGGQRLEQEARTGPEYQGSTDGLGGQERLGSAVPSRSGPTGYF